MKKLAICLTTSLSVLAFPIPVNAQKKPDNKPGLEATFAGSYNGTFLCEFGEMGLTLILKSPTKFTPDDFTGNPCRSAAGRCNNEMTEKSKNARKISGVVHVFPMNDNSEAPSGVFEVTGRIDKISKQLFKMEMERGKGFGFPDNYASSSLTAVWANGTIHLQPIEPRCQKLFLVKPPGGLN